MFLTRKKYLFCTLSILFGTYKLYYYNFGMASAEMFQNQQLGTRDFLINTPGCYIPNYAKTFTYNTSFITPFIAYTLVLKACGERAVFIETKANNTIKFRIHKKKLEKYNVPCSKNRTEIFRCCYKFATHSNDTAYELYFSKCSPFKDGSEVKLEHEIIKVLCGIYESKQIIVIYEDVYIMIKKKNIVNNSSAPWNVLLLGIDTMSRTRAFDTMPLTTTYLQTRKWLDYKAYQKVADNTFPNLMSVLTGKNMTTIFRQCGSGLFKCADYFIWEKYKTAGYTTALGEDYVGLPDTFSKYNGFKKKPADHYMRPFYFIGEEFKNNILCTKKKPSATHLLHYARSFVESYKNNNFFGMFWINSYSHNEDANPSFIDGEIVHFFKRLENDGTFNNTFVIFFSDHGVRYGAMSFQMESYYDNRLPMFFIWIPHSFRRQYKEKYNNLQLNQNRLISPYDLYMTIAEILKLSTNSTNEFKSEGCHNCTSLFEEKSPLRTCADAGVSDVWCSCHNMTKIKISDKQTRHSMELAISHLRNKIKSIKTKTCMKCKEITKSTVWRSHVYHQDNNTYQVTAFHLFPNRIGFESIIIYYGNTSDVLSLRTISPYNKRGNCVLDPNHRPYCLCTIDQKCHNKTILNLIKRRWSLIVPAL